MYIKNMATKMELQKEIVLADCKWAKYDTSEFPLVKVKIEGVVESDEDFQKFLDNWKKLYEYDTKFTLFFDTRRTGFVLPKYAWKMKNFIQELKDLYRENPEKDLLECSFISVKTRWVKFLLNSIFWSSKPVAPVYIYTDYGNLNPNEIIESVQKGIKPKVKLNIFTP